MYTYPYNNKSGSGSPPSLSRPPDSQSGSDSGPDPWSVYGCNCVPGAYARDYPLPLPALDLILAKFSCDSSDG